MSFESFKKVADNRIKFGLFLFNKLPSAWLCGVRPKSISEAGCSVVVPYKWLSQNPFRSTYFACQAMAAEMSTGLLAMGHLYNRKPAVSMLVVEIKGEFFKKATNQTIFTCTDGIAIQEAIEKAVESGEGTAIVAVSEGRNNSGELVSRFSITWSFKAKRQ